MAALRPVGKPTLVPVAISFALFGAFWGGWAVAAADIERQLHVSDGGFGLILSAALAGAIVTNGVGGALAERHGTGPVLAVALAVWGALLLAAAAVHPPFAFGALVISALISGGLIDVTMNVAATAQLGRTPGRLVRFHAWWNIGGVLGALGTGIALASISWRWAWTVDGVVALGLAVACIRLPLPAGEPGEPTKLTGALALLRKERLLVVAAAFAVGALVEGGVDLWGVLYLRDRLHSGLVVGTGSAMSGYGVAAIVRIVLGPAAGRSGASKGVTIGATTATAGLLVLGLAPWAWLSGVGLIAAAGGMSLCWPLLLAHATSASPRPGAIVGSVSAVGYLGIVLGPTIVGLLAATIGLRGALITLSLGAIFVAVSPLFDSSRQPTS